MVQLFLQTLRKKAQFLVWLLVVNISSGVLVQAAHVEHKEQQKFIVCHDPKLAQENDLTTNDILSILESDDALVCLGKMGQELFVSLYNHPTKNQHSVVLQKCCKRILEGYTTISYKDLLDITEEIYAILETEENNKYHAYVQELVQATKLCALAFSTETPKLHRQPTQNPIDYYELYLAPDANVAPKLDITYQAGDIETKTVVTVFTAGISPASVSSLHVNTKNLFVSSQAGVTPRAETGVLVSPGTTLFNNIGPWKIANPDGTTPLSAGTKILNVSNFFFDPAGTTNFGGNVSIAGNLTVNGSTISGNSNYTFSSDVFIDKDSTLFVSEIDPRSPGTTTTFSGNVNLNKNLVVDGNLTVLGSSNIGGGANYSFSSDVFIANGATLFVSEIDPRSPSTTTGFSGNVSIAGDTIEHGTLTVTGSTSLIGDVITENNLTVDGDLTVLGSTNIVTSANYTFSTDVFIADGATLFVSEIDPRSPATATQFSGDVSLVGNINGNLNIPNTSSSSVGVIEQNSSSLIHTYPTGNNNTFVGNSAGNFTLSSQNNTGVGTNSLISITSSTGNNTAVGSVSLQTLTTGNNNTGVGFGAIENMSTGNNNTGVGYITLNGLTSGNDNIALGNSAGSSHSGSDSNNIDIGNVGVSSDNNIIRLGTPGSHTTTYLVGDVVLESAKSLSNTSGTVNITGDINANSGTFTVDTSGNISTLANINIPNTTSSTVGVIDQNSVSFIHTYPTGNSNTFVGNSAGNFTLSSPNNTGLGTSTLASLGSSSGFNTAVGSISMTSLGTGNNNTAVGYDTLNSISSGNNNIALGSTAGAGHSGGDSNNIDIGNVGVGGDNNIIRLGTVGSHTATYLAGDVTFVGNINIPSTTSSTVGVIDQNGASFIHTYPTGNFNTFLGNSAGNFTLSSSNNTGLGTNSLLNLGASNGSNTAVGSASLQNVSTGDSNTAVGTDSLFNVTSGSSNTAVGDGSLVNISTGINNIALGIVAGSSHSGSDSNNIDIGNTGIGGDNNIIRLGTVGSHTNTYLAGDVTFSGNINIPNTSSSSVGVIEQNSTRFIHSYPTGNSNTFVGDSAGNFTLSSSNNTGLGTNSLTNLGSTSGSNTAVGADALQNLSTGDNNTAVGFDSLANVSSSGSGNTAVGSGTLTSLSSGSNNIALGNSAGSSHGSSDSNNIDIGNIGTNGDNNIIRLGTSGSHTNTYLVGAVSFDSSINIPTTSSSTIGVIDQNGASFIHSFGTNNTFLGDSAGNFGLSSSNNTGLGTSSLANLGSTSGNNTAVGTDALLNLNTGDNNTAIGSFSLDNLSSGGSGNTAVGNSSLISLSSGSNNIALGNNAGSSHGGGDSNNIDIGNIGVSSDNNIIRLGTTGSHTTTYLAGDVVFESGKSLSVDAIKLPTTSSSTVGVIDQNGASFIHSFGTNNTFLGDSAGNFGLSSSNNTGLGTTSLANLGSTSGNNTAVGTQALLNLNTGDNNTAIGSFSLESVSSGGSNNTAVGNSTLASLSSGSNNIALGNNAGSSHSGSDSNNIDIGNIGVSSDNNIIRLGTTGSHTTTYLAGDVIFESGKSLSVDAIKLPSTTSSTVGVIDQNGNSLIHTYPTGNGNTFVGNSAGNFTLSSSNNTALGTNSLTGLGSTSGSNTAVGTSSLQNLNTGDNNTAIGSFSLDNLSSGGSGNTAVGSGTLTSITSGVSNIALGNSAGNSLSGSDSNNIDIGNSGVGGDTNIIRLGTTGSHTTTYLAGDVVFESGKSLSNAGGTINISSDINVNSGNFTVAASTGTIATLGDINMPGTTSSTAGVINFSSTRFIHNYPNNNSNLFVGTSAGNFTLSSSENTGIGTNSLENLGSSSGANTAVGSGSLQSLSSGSNNTAVGRDTMISLSSGTSNVGIGDSTIASVTSGNNNIAIGSAAGSSLTGGDSNNIDIGSPGVSGDNNIIRLGNTGSITSTYLAGDVILESGKTLSNAGGTIAISSDINVNSGNFTVAASTGTISTNGDINMPGTTSSTAGVINFSGNRFIHNYPNNNNNTFVGTSAGNFTLLSGNNTGIGTNALINMGSSSGNNTAVGSGSMTGLNTGGSNTAVGASAMTSVSNGSSNTAVGNSTLSSITSGNNNTALGLGAGNGLTGSDSNNIDIGNSGVSGDNNIIRIGSTGSITSTYLAGDVILESGKSLSNAGGTLAISSDINVSSGKFTVTASSGTMSTLGDINIPATTNSAAGVINQNSTRFIHSFGSTDNTFVGTSAGNFTLSSSTNTGLGASALTSLGSSSGGNTAVGGSSMVNLTTGNSNVGVGNNSLSGANTASGNTALGINSLNAISSGNSNIAIGNGAGSSLTGSNSSNIDIGHTGTSGDNSVIRIGSGQTSCFIAGISGATSSGGVAVLINGSGQLGTTTSSQRYKEDICDMNTASENLLKLRPVTFKYKKDIDPSGLQQYGLIAEEVAQIAPELVVYSPKDGQPETVRYHLLTPMLLNEYQRQNSVIQDMLARLAVLEKEVAGNKK